ncbi:hypothetical protein Acr_00g0076110 [Actinidia rufa]|uniref:Uncharacterized protein n=1 Tax=Actinidia rufa TaxID=165716 RepID=A0A7J0DSV2_9ERIC|nr:hypothetical protein Acr_00g0076110 [Actinidia rufa]
MGLALSTKVKLKQTRPSMKVLSIQKHTRDMLSPLRTRKRDMNWARDHKGWGFILKMSYEWATIIRAIQLQEGLSAQGGVTADGGCIEVWTAERLGYTRVRAAATGDFARGWVAPEVGCTRGWGCKGTAEVAAV